MTEENINDHKLLVLSFEKQQYCFQGTQSVLSNTVQPSYGVSVKIKQIRCIKWEKTLKGKSEKDNLL